MVNFKNVARQKSHLEEVRLENERDDEEQRMGTRTRILGEIQECR